MDTNKLTKQINTMLRPRAALIAYSTDGGDTYFLEVRSIDNEGAMSEGRPVTVDFINELIKGYSERHSSTPHGRIPTNMLWSDTRKGYEKYIWYNPPQKRMMFFKESLHIENAEYNLPGVIYEVRDERMGLHCRPAGSGRPNAGHRLRRPEGAGPVVADLRTARFRPLECCARVRGRAGKP